jgi:integrase
MACVTKRRGKWVVDWRDGAGSRSTAGTTLDAANVRKAFARALKKAELPAHFTPHSLRHTFASILLAEGKSPAYVQAQLGHASITLTVDTYGRWLPKGDKAAVDSLDDAPAKRSGDQVVTFGDKGGESAAQLPDLESGPPRNRTANPLIKSPGQGATATVCIRLGLGVSRTLTSRRRSLSARVARPSRTERAQYRRGHSSPCLPRYPVRPSACLTICLNLSAANLDARVPC